MSDAFFAIFIITIVILSFTLSISARLQQENREKRNFFNNDYIPPKSPLDVPVRIKPHRVKAITEADHRDEINGKNIIHREIPEKGFVVLNGIKRRIYDCKDL